MASRGPDESLPKLRHRSTNGGNPGDRGLPRDAASASSIGIIYDRQGDDTVAIAVAVGSFALAAICYLLMGAVSADAS